MLLHVIREELHSSLFCSCQVFLVLDVALHQVLQPFPAVRGVPDGIATSIAIRDSTAFGASRGRPKFVHELSGQPNAARLAHVLGVLLLGPGARGPVSLAL